MIIHSFKSSEIVISDTIFDFLFILFHYFWFFDLFESLEVVQELSYYFYFLIYIRLKAQRFCESSNIIFDFPFARKLRESTKSWPLFFIYFYSTKSLEAARISATIFVFWFSLFRKLRDCENSDTSFYLLFIQKLRESAKAQILVFILHSSSEKVYNYSVCLCLHLVVCPSFGKLFEVDVSVYWWQSMVGWNEFKKKPNNFIVTLSDISISSWKPVTLSVICAGSFELNLLFNQISFCDYYSQKITKGKKKNSKMNKE